MMLILFIENIQLENKQNPFRYIFFEIIVINVSAELYIYTKKTYSSAYLFSIHLLNSFFTKLTQNVLMKFHKRCQYVLIDYDTACLWIAMKNQTRERILNVTVLTGRRMDGTKRSMVRGEVGRFKDEAYTMGV